jgi:hypothetical protein
MLLAKPPMDVNSVDRYTIRTVISQQLTAFQQDFWCPCRARKPESWLLEAFSRQLFADQKYLNIVTQYRHRQ